MSNPRKQAFEATEGGKTLHSLQRESVQKASIKTLQIGLFGLFGSGNSGNDGSLQAMVAFLRKSVPTAELVCICAQPRFVQENYGICSISFSSPAFKEGWSRRIDRILGHLPLLFVNWIYALIALRTLDVLIVPGTGILDDFGTGPVGVPYALFRWCLAARLCGVRVAFVSIGAGPIHHPISRWLMKTAAGVASYRSYRDLVSKNYMTSIGFDASRDPVYPDLAFALPLPPQLPSRSSGKPTVGVGVMTYKGWRGSPEYGPAILSAYLGKIKAFVLWLLDEGYDVRLLIGDEGDGEALNTLLRALVSERPGAIGSRLVSSPVFSLEDIMREMALIDVVVATRFHNVVCALKMNKPTISIGYADKNDVLLRDAGLGEFCLSIETFEVERLKDLFLKLAAGREDYERGIAASTQAYDRRLKQQEQVLLDEVLFTQTRAHSR